MPLCERGERQGNQARMWPLQISVMDVHTYVKLCLGLGARGQATRCAQGKHIRTILYFLTLVPTQATVGMHLL
jgi:hypothetical protein